MNPKNQLAIEIINDGESMLTEIYNKHPQFDIIEKAIEKLRSIGYENPHVVSDHITVISSYLSSIGNVIARYVAYANGTYIYRKYRYFSALKEKIAEGITKAKEYADEISLDVKKEEAMWQYVADVLKSKEKAYYNHISVLQSRLGILKQEIITWKNNGT